MISDDLADTLDRWLSTHCEHTVIKQLARGETFAPLWDKLDGLGFGDALVDEAHGGAGLSLAQLAGSLFVAGKRLCPFPMGETMVARALIRATGAIPPQGPILLLSPTCDLAGRWNVRTVPLALCARHALVEISARQFVVDLADCDVVASNPGLSLAADIAGNEASPLPVSVSLRPIAAALRALAIAGLCSAVVALTAEHARTRQQFGRAISEFQAVQQQLAVLAEEFAAAQAAAALGCTNGLKLSLAHAAIAKSRCSVAAVDVSRIAHAVHGAIGISEEYDLHLFTRRLAEERMADGGETYWHEQLGRLRVRSSATPTVAFLNELEA